MKNKEVISGVVGASFFALGYLALSVAVVPSLLIGAGAYVASELVLNGNKKEEILGEVSLEDKIKDARLMNKHIKDMKEEIDSIEVKKQLEEINKTTNKIINTIEKNNISNKSTYKFFDYYLPVCVNIVDRYDEIENQELTSEDSKKFMKNSIKMIDETSKAFKKILNSLYQNDIENNEAEMKVYNQMLKSDGYNQDEIEVEGEDDE